jgi:hypothetical protein
MSNVNAPTFDGSAPNNYPKIIAALGQVHDQISAIESNPQLIEDNAAATYLSGVIVGNLQYLRDAEAGLTRMAALAGRH